MQFGIHTDEAAVVEVPTPDPAVVEASAAAEASAEVSAVAGAPAAVEAPAAAEAPAAVETATVEAAESK